MKTTERLKALAEACVPNCWPFTTAAFNKASNPATVKELCELVEVMEVALESAANPFPRHGVVQAIADEALARVAKFQKGE